VFFAAFSLRQETIQDKKNYDDRIEESIVLKLKILYHQTSLIRPTDQAGTAAMYNSFASSGTNWLYEWF
jgi:hypothetical protein